MPTQSNTSDHISQHFPALHPQESTAAFVLDLHGRYVTSTLNYTQKLQHLTLEIEKCKTNINQQLQENAAQEQTHDALLKEQAIEERLLEKVHQTHLQNTDSLIALEREYKPHLQADKYQRLHTNKEEALRHTQEEIEALEHTLLHRELERLNLLEILTPKRAKLSVLQQTLTKLEQNKSYLERTALQQIHQDAQAILPASSTQPEATDTEILN